MFSPRSPTGCGSVLLDRRQRLNNDRLPRDERLVIFAARLLAKAKRPKDAEGPLWRAFKADPSLACYKELFEIGGRPPAELAILLVETNLAQQTSPRGARANLLVGILQHEKRFDAAWAAVRQFGASAPVKQTLARATETRYLREAIEVYAAHVDQLATLAAMTRSQSWSDTLPRFKLPLSTRLI